ncbi:MAG: cysteine desulfurase family protein [Sphaerochaetaceae bacterium]|nr:cysteine desulfurase [Sphaerochaetaceae bacterium]MDD4259056.1 cysteine desulfurase family protein [Sphaerochaetaceae bacterium]MDD4762725.1 cysteine desulfurase family protein [Sphaerochaetaceae bacterium]MDD4842574.1 cysteine desulfurase family protein [Sphaerochaetaceae bacterium]MDD5076664.1 cysteine desulfurase family protein [Sphaerochaetaceae bacterium]
MHMISGYFDWAATTMMSERALDAYHDAARHCIGNPSAAHALGRQAATMLQDMREKTASLLDIDVKSVVYTSGGTEANSIAILSQLWRRSPKRVIFSSLEHAAVSQHKRLLETMGFEVVVAPSINGYLDVDKFRSLLSDDVQLVCVMLANNVVGTVQDIPALVSCVREHEKLSGRRIHFHCDAVQMIGKKDLKLSTLDIDSAAMSAHKFQGPRGVGLLYAPSGSLESLSKGGGQEHGLRGGTENIAGIVAMNTALEDIRENIHQDAQHVLHLRKLLEDQLYATRGIMPVSPRVDDGKDILNSVMAISIPAFPSEVTTRILSDNKLYVSSGSACSNNAKRQHNRQLVDFGYPAHMANHLIRISFGPSTTEEECDRLISCLRHIASGNITNVMR